MAPGTPRELLADAVDFLADKTKSVAVMAVGEPRVEQGLKRAGEGVKRAEEGIKRAAEGVKAIGERVPVVGEGVKRAADVTKLAQGKLRSVLRARRGERPDDPEKPDEKKKG